MITFVDLVYNYDLLVHSTTYLYLQRVNPPKELILCTFTNIQNMIHSLRRVFWDYQSTYGGDTQDVTITPHPPPSRYWPRKWVRPSHMVHIQYFYTQPTKRIQTRGILQMLYLRRYIPYGRILLCRQLYNSVTVTLTQHTYRRYSKHQPRRPENLFRCI